MRFPRTAFLLGCLVVLVLLAIPSVGQSPNGNINGLVLDQTGHLIAAAEIIAVNDFTNVQFTTKSNSEGIYVLPNLPPGPYRIQVAKTGFKTMIKPDIVLNVQDALSINFTLPVGAVIETVTVAGGAPLVNTQSASVSTVIDRQFVANLPLNGRSFNTLLQLTPGVVIAPTNSYSQGQFSIAGQRTSANNFLVDGVSANFGVSPTASVGNSGGSAQAFSALGGTSSLVSVEALQEFRVETSSFAPEFGRTPGGQVILTTRSGTNEFHGRAYEYFRNDVLDANDWFANHAGLSRAPERHNDFGGVLGGPIRRDRSFFFVSFEAARLRQPRTKVVQVPSQFARTTASDPISPFLAAYPLPDDRTSIPGVFTGIFTGNYSNPSTLNAGSVRIDHTFNRHVSLFGRYNEAPSQAAARTNSLSQVDTTDVGTRTATVGSTFTISPRLSNSLRGNYSRQTSSRVTRLDSFGGAVPAAPSVLAPNLTQADNTTITFFTFDTGAYQSGPQARNKSTQVNIADDLVFARGAHQLKFGGDYRAIHLDLVPAQILQYLISSVPNFLSTSTADFGIFGFSAKPTKLLFRSTSLYAQDMWKISPRLTLTYGLRWELNPAPSGRDGTTLAAWPKVKDPAMLAVAPAGTALWSTTYANLAPRAGVAYALDHKGSLVVRAGAGIFYDQGSDYAAYLGSTFPNTAFSCCPSASLPLNNAEAFLPKVSALPPYPDGTTGFTPDLKLPRSYQWNLALEKSLGEQQVLSVTYVGQAGRRLLRQEAINRPNMDFSGAFLLIQNNALSNYHALQLQYRRPLSSNVQALLNYTWSHSLDNASSDTVAAKAVSSKVISAANDYASSDFDIRHSFSGALSWALPGAKKNRPFSWLTRDWSLEAVVATRSGLPFNAVVLTSTIAGAYPRPDLVSGEPRWIANPRAAGGKSLNPRAFTPPASGTQGSEGRNDIAGFGLTQVDLSLSRKIAITERVHLQFRTDAFNVLNHPNFTNPLAYVGLGSAPLESASMLNSGLGGLNPLFQQGGPRSLQLSLSLTF